MLSGTCKERQRVDKSQSETMPNGKAAKLTALPIEID